MSFSRAPEPAEGSHLSAHFSALEPAVCIAMRAGIAMLVMAIATLAMIIATPAAAA